MHDKLSRDVDARFFGNRTMDEERRQMFVTVFFFLNSGRETSELTTRTVVNENKRLEPERAGACSVPFHHKQDKMATEIRCGNGSPTHRRKKHLLFGLHNIDTPSSSIVARRASGLDVLRFTAWCAITTVGLWVRDTLGRLRGRPVRAGEREMYALFKKTTKRFPFGAGMREFKERPGDSRI